MALPTALEHSTANLKHVYDFIENQPVGDSCRDREDHAAMIMSTRSPSSRSLNSIASTNHTSSTDSNCSSTLVASPLNPQAATFEPLPAPVSTNSIPGQLFELRNIVGKGFGLFATSFIPVGTRIISESPLLCVGDHDLHLVWGSYCRLSDAKKAVFDKLHFFKPAHLDLEYVSRYHLIDSQDDVLDHDGIEEQVQAHVRVMGTFASNNYQCGKGLAVYETASRLNHSCVPNVHHSFNPTLRKQTVHAARDIFPGEELCTTYLGGQATYFVRAQRIHMLRDQYGFTCACPACSDPTGTSDSRRELMGGIAWGLQQYLDGCKTESPFLPRTPAAALLQVEALIQNLLGEGLITMELVKAYRMASQQAVCLKDFDKALEYAQNEAEVERNCLGREVDDLRRIGAAAAEWIQQIKSMKSPAKKTKKAKKAVEAKKVVEAKANQATPSKAEQKKLRKKAEEERKKAKEEKHRQEREAEQARKEYEKTWPTVTGSKE